MYDVVGGFRATAPAKCAGDWVEWNLNERAFVRRDRWTRDARRLGLGNHCVPRVRSRREPGQSPAGPGSPPLSDLREPRPGLLTAPPNPGLHLRRAGSPSLPLVD